MPTALHITGPSTIPCRRDLKAIGARWNPDIQAWLAPISRRPQLDQLAEIANIDLALYDTQARRVIRRLRPWLNRLP